MCQSDKVDAVWVATPNHLHAQHAIIAAAHKKHVIVSKPMAVTLEEAEAMTAAAQRNGVVLLAGHTQSMAPTMRAMADIVQRGELGQARHAPHVALHGLDVPSTPAGRVRQCSRRRSRVSSGLAPGGYHPHDRREATPFGPRRYGQSRPLIRGPRRVHGVPPAPGWHPCDHRLFGYGHFTMQNPAPRATSLGMFGITTVTCEHGDMRESAEGLLIYSRDGVREIHIADELRGTPELDELYAAVHHGEPCATMATGGWPR